MRGTVRGVVVWGVGLGGGWGVSPPPTTAAATDHDQHHEDRRPSPVSSSSSSAQSPCSRPGQPTPTPNPLATTTPGTNATWVCHWHEGLECFHEQLLRASAHGAGRPSDTGEVFLDTRAQWRQARLCLAFPCLALRPGLASAAGAHLMPSPGGSLSPDTHAPRLLTFT